MRKTVWYIQSEDGGYCISTYDKFTKAYSYLKSRYLTSDSTFFSEDEAKKQMANLNKEFPDHEFKLGTKSVTDKQLENIQRYGI